MIFRTTGGSRRSGLEHDCSEEIRSGQAERCALVGSDDDFATFDRLRAVGCLEGLQARIETHQRVFGKVFGGQDVDNQLPACEPVPQTLATGDELEADLA